MRPSNERQPERRGAFPVDYAAIFTSTDSGVAVLDDLMTRFDASISFVAGEDGDRITAFREGQRSVVRFILEAVAAGQAGAEKMPRPAMR